MPELPEVETIRASLEPLVRGRRVRSVVVFEPRLRCRLDAKFGRRLQGHRIVRARRRGKYLLFDLEDASCWIVHFGMSGRLLYDERIKGREKHDHVIVSLEDGGRLTFRDPRRFGLMLVAEPASCALLAHLGPEPLDPAAFDEGYLGRVGRRTTRTVKDVLMDQRVVAGLGNIYVNEILFRSSLRPRRRLRTLSRSDRLRLVESTRSVLEEAIVHRGSSVSDFLDGIGRRGGYQWRHCVYEREGEPCIRCRTAIRSVTVGQRSSFYCPRCQR